MKRRPRWVVDTNVMVSVFPWQDTPGPVILRVEAPVNVFIKHDPGCGAKENNTPPYNVISNKAGKKSSWLKLMNSDTYEIEEYRHLAAVIVEVEKLMLQIFVGTFAFAVPLLSALTGWLLQRSAGAISILGCYAMLAPNLLVLPSFYLLLSQRTTLIRLGSYRRVFFEERNEIKGWETRLETFRKMVRTESNDPIAYTFWVVSLLSAVLFVYAIYKSCESPFNLLILFAPFTFLVWCHNKWICVVRREFPKYLEHWRAVLIAGSNPSVPII
jgi:hypothetical protein